MFCHKFCVFSISTKIDNNINNLEWTTSKENTNHAINTGLRKEKIQNGEDNCEEYAVYLEDFVKLQLCLSLVLDAQNTCLAGRLSESERDVICLDNFPPTEGFFFGSREIDDFYWEDVVSTKKIVESIIIQMNQSIIDKDSILINYYYRSSW